MTQQQKVLTHLASSKSGLTAVELRDLTNIPQNTLGTLLWDLGKHDLITRVGGARGSYRYGITEKGRDYLPDTHKDPITRLAEAFKESGLETSGSFKELAKLAGSVSDYRLLRRFWGWVMSTAPELVNGSITDPHDLTQHGTERILEYLGIDTQSYYQQREALSALLDLV